MFEFVTPPGDDAFDFNIQAKAQERADQDDQAKQADAFPRQRRGNCRYNVGPDQKFQPEQDSAARIGAKPVIGAQAKATGPWSRFGRIFLSYTASAVP
jgi:hypothetical protein